MAFLNLSVHGGAVQQAWLLSARAQSKTAAKPSLGGRNKEERGDKSSCLLNLSSTCPSGNTEGGKQPFIFGFSIFHFSFHSVSFIDFMKLKKNLLLKVHACPYFENLKILHVFNITAVNIQDIFETFSFIYVLQTHLYITCFINSCSVKVRL